MKIKISFLLLLILSAFSASGAVIQGTSGPFPFGGGAPPVPVSFLALAISAGLIGSYSLWRHFRQRGKVSA